MFNQLNNWQVSDKFNKLTDVQCVYTIAWT